MANRPCPRVLGIDEHFFTRKNGYATTFEDLKGHRVFDVKLGRSEPSLRSYLRSIEERDKVQVVVMDLSETYRSITLQIGARRRPSIVNGVEHTRLLLPLENIELNKDKRKQP
jgi:transposase